MAIEQAKIIMDLYRIGTENGVKVYKKKGAFYSTFIYLLRVAISLQAK